MLRAPSLQFAPVFDRLRPVRDWFRDPSFMSHMMRSDFATAARARVGAAAAGGAPSLAGLGSLMGLMGGLGGGVPPAAVPSRPPADMYATQLEEMASMGFSDRAQNLRALSRSGGDLQGAVNFIMDGAV